MMNINCEISLGELVDKLSILRIKSQKIHDAEKLVHVRKEEEILSQLLKSLQLEKMQHHLDQMIDINLQLWVIEDDIRDLERNKDFGEKFIQLARAVYITNDERFKRKNTINTTYKSGLVEVKSYKDY
ncbi:DUF6165 family protein [Bacteriovorax sp. PP10]|uniref:DUF6165 family protein n=1 Tax=Bacteriovorax antarcticus TaxID=3088717 RepID=A0ABU5VR55_9BACT|nr:DUF6165 family protein [Bacteriovorax sp. PP10]MEA9355519.1 DUF6165 family protein [Bacteriovorax sp. PP10]